MFTDTARITGGTDRRHEVIEGIRDGALLDARIPVERPHPAAQDFRHTRPHEIAQLCLGWIGQRAEGMSSQRIIDMALQRDMRSAAATLGVVDLPGIVLQIAQKAIAIGAASAAQTWRAIARRTSVETFRQEGRVHVSELPLLTRTAENGEITSSAVETRIEYAQAAPFTRMLGISREALVAGEVDAWTAVPFAVGQAGEATINQEVFATLALNSGLGPTLAQDSTALFDASAHGNYTATGAAPTVTTLSLGRKQMRRQTDHSTGRRLNIPPAVLLAPPSLEGECRVLAAADYVQGDASNLRVAIDAALEDGTNGTTAWYLVANPDQYAGLEVAFLGGGDVPTLDEVRNGVIDGIVYRARLDFGVACTDYRGLYRNKGTT